MPLDRGGAFVAALLVALVSLCCLRILAASLLRRVERLAVRSSGFQRQTAAANFALDQVFRVLSGDIEPQPFIPQLQLSSVGGEFHYLLKRGGPWWDRLAAELPRSSCRSPQPAPPASAASHSCAALAGEIRQSTLIDGNLAAPLQISAPAGEELIVAVLGDLTSSAPLQIRCGAGARVAIAAAGSVNLPGLDSDCLTLLSGGDVKLAALPPPPARLSVEARGVLAIGGSTHASPFGPPYRKNPRYWPAYRISGEFEPR